MEVVGSGTCYDVGVWGVVHVHVGGYSCTGKQTTHWGGTGCHTPCSGHIGTGCLVCVCVMCVCDVCVCVMCV